MWCRWFLTRFCSRVTPRCLVISVAKYFSVTVRFGSVWKFQNASCCETSLSICRVLVAEWFIWEKASLMFALKCYGFNKLLGIASVFFSWLEILWTYLLTIKRGLQNNRNICQNYWRFGNDCCLFRTDNSRPGTSYFKEN